MADPTPTAAPSNIDQPGFFYLGQEYDLDNKAVVPDKPILFDVRDLTTHGVVVGMTGSGKTGLCISLLEEAALNGIPCVMIDPKGDLTNILLQFPELDPRNFRSGSTKGTPGKRDCRRTNTPSRWPTAGARGWRKRTRSPERIGRLKEKSGWRIYTPGSESGLPLSILGSFAAPKDNQPLEEKAQKAEAIASGVPGPDRRERQPDPVA